MHSTALLLRPRRRRDFDSLKTDSLQVSILQYCHCHCTNGNCSSGGRGGEVVVLVGAGVGSGGGGAAVGSGDGLGTHACQLRFAEQL